MVSNGCILLLHHYAEKNCNKDLKITYLSIYPVYIQLKAGVTETRHQFKFQILVISNLSHVGQILRYFTRVCNHGFCTCESRVRWRLTVYIIR